MQYIIIIIIIIKVQYNGCDSFVEAAASRRIKRHESSRITRSSHMLNIV
jgi:hypothetical protein